MVPVLVTQAQVVGHLLFMIVMVAKRYLVMNVKQQIIEWS